MAAEQGVVERLRHQVEHRSGQTEFYAIDYGELEALLAVVEAAQKLADRIEPGDWTELRKALAALHTQASDEGKP